MIYHFHEISDDQEQWKILGYFSSKKKAQEALNKYKELPGFKDNPPTLGDPGIGGTPSWEGGFSSFTYSLDEEDGTTLTDDEEEEGLVLEIPYWAKDERPMPLESSEAFAHRLMQAHNLKNYPTAPESEFYQLKVWAEQLKKYRS